MALTFNHEKSAIFLQYFALSLGAALGLGGGMENFFMCLFTVFPISFFTKKPNYGFILLGMLALGTPYIETRNLGGTAIEGAWNGLTYASLAILIALFSFQGAEIINRHIPPKHYLYVLLALGYFTIFILSTIFLVASFRYWHGL